MALMALKYIMVVTLIGLIGLSVSSIAGVASYYTERAVEELKLMTEPELAGEARLVCLDIASRLRMQKKYLELKAPSKAIQDSELGQRGRRYLERIGLVVRDRHHGQMPAWFEQVSRAPNSPDDEACDTAATAGGWRKKER
jgi:hypothetical protein